MSTEEPLEPETFVVDEESFNQQRDIKSLRPSQVVHQQGAWS